MSRKRCIVLVLDGFGVGAMKDTKVVRPGDERANTLGSILSDFPNLKLPNLEKLGLMNAFGRESKNMKFSENACWGKSELLHYGADTFMGHQEIMGTLPKKPVAQPFQQKVDEIKNCLLNHNYKVEEKSKNGLRYLLINGAVTVADNIDADLGMAYNCTAPLDAISFEEELKIGRIVREIATVNRVIVFGGSGNTINDILKAEETRPGGYIGIHAVKSKSYENNYHCLHLGYGVDKSVQVPTILTEAGIQVSLFGKVADIVANEKGKSVSCVDTTEVLNKTLEEIKNIKEGFICTNIQETDLAGHSQDSKWYRELLEVADDKIGNILSLLTEQDLLIIMADHGNDPKIGHNRHTRENIPLLVYQKGIENKELGLRRTLSDVGATVCDFFDVHKPQNGTSFI